MAISFSKKHISQGFKTIKSIKDPGPSKGFMHGAGQQHSVPFKGSRTPGPRPFFRIKNDRDIAEANKNRKPRHSKYES